MNIGKRGGFKGGKRLQGGWLTAALGLATAIFGSKKAKSDKKAAEKQLAASDPYGKYRDAAAQRLNTLMNDPSAIYGTAEYKARQKAVERLMASQGYTGSGNALVEAADASGESYQQAFNNLALLAGANAQPGGSNQALANVSSARDTSASSYANIANNAANLFDSIFNRGP
jgi:hypothetical protein